MEYFIVLVAVAVIGWEWLGWHGRRYVSAWFWNVIALCLIVGTVVSCIRHGDLPSAPSRGPSDSWGN